MDMFTHLLVCSGYFDVKLLVAHTKQQEQKTSYTGLFLLPDKSKFEGYVLLELEICMHDHGKHTIMYG